MDIDAARDTIEFSERLRDRTRKDVSRPSLPLALLASFSVASLSLTESVVSPKALVWAFVTPIAMGALAIWAYRRSHRIGVDGSPLAYVAVSVGLLILAYAFGKAAFAFAVPQLGRLGPPLVVAAGYFALAVIERNLTLASVAVALALAVGASSGFALTSAQSEAVLFAIYGGALVLIGYAMRLGRAELS